MISFGGMVWGIRDASYIYAVINDWALYVGETGDIPPKRWGQHFATGGTFSGKAADAGIELGGPSETLFIAIRCPEIDNENAPYRKLARRTVEEEVHRQFVLDSRPFGDEFKLISSPPPAPIRYNWSFDAVAIAKQIHAVILTQYLSWKNREPEANVS